MNMRKLILIFTLFLSILTLSACDFIFIEEPNGDNDDPPIYNVNEFTRQELIDLVESLMDESYSRVEYDLESLEAVMTEMLESRGETVVGVSAFGSLGSGGTASGVIYHKEGNDYYVVTNHHVLQPDGRTSPFPNVEIVYERNGLRHTISNANTEIIGLNQPTDLAVIRFSSNENFPVATFADSYELNNGQFVFAIGNPLGFNYFGSVTMGIISGQARFVPGSEYEVPFLQHDAAISPGNSGGALFDINGNLIGINNMKIVDDATTNIGFAIPSNTVERVTQALQEDGVFQRPFFGISAAEGVADCNQEYGVCVSSISGDGTAGQTSLSAGDVIIGFKTEDEEDYRTVLNFNELREAILNSKVGSQVSIQYLRNGETHETDYVELVVHPDDR